MTVTVAFNITVWYISVRERKCCWKRGKLVSDDPPPPPPPYFTKQQILEPIPIRKHSQTLIWINSKSEVCYEMSRKHCGKWRKCGNQHFLLFPQCFQKGCFSRSLKVGMVKYMFIFFLSHNVFKGLITALSKPVITWKRDDCHHWRFHLCLTLYKIIPYLKISRVCYTPVQLGPDLRRSVRSERGRSPQIAAVLVILRTLQLRQPDDASPAIK